MSLHWNPHHLKRRALIDCTDLSAPGHEPLALLQTKTTINQPEWYKKNKRIAPPNLQPTSVCIAYLPLTTLFYMGQPINDLFNRIPHGAVIEIVRPHWDLRAEIGTHLHVSHIGFSFKDTSAGPFFYHASRTKGCVTRQRLSDYLRAYLNHPTVRGILVFEPQFI